MPRPVSLLLLCSALVLCVGCPRAPEPPPPNKPAAPLQPRLDAFQKAWNEGARADVTAFMARDVRKRKSQLMRKLFRRREWEEKRPPVTKDREDSVVDHQVAVFWTIEGEEKVMQTDWQWENDDWWLLDLKLRIRK